MADQNGNDIAQAQLQQAPDPLSAPVPEHQDLKKTKSEKIKELEQVLEQHEREINQLSRLQRTQERIQELELEFINSDSQSEAVDGIFAMMSSVNSTLLSIEENVNRICQWQVRESSGNTSSPDSQSKVDEILVMLSAFNSTMSFIRETLTRGPPNRSNIQLPLPKPSYLGIRSESESTDESIEPNSTPTSSRQSLSTDEQDHDLAEFSDAESTSGGKEEKTCDDCQTYELMYECSSCMTQWYRRKLCQLCWMESHYKDCDK